MCVDNYQGLYDLCFFMKINISEIWIIDNK